MFEEFLRTISKWNVILGLCIAVLALAFMIAARPISKKIYKDKTEEEQTNLAMVFKIIAGALALAGCIIVMFVNVS